MANVSHTPGPYRNPNLIAAAPDLMAALEELVGWALEQNPDHDGMEDDVPGHLLSDETGLCVICSARAAIAKAKGDQL